MSELLLTFSQFHFLRPLWLLAIPVGLILVILFWKQRASALNWGKAINQQLLDYLVDDSANKLVSSTRWPWLVLFIAWCIAAIALAGPTWQKLPQPVHQKQDALVIVLDLSLSMYSEDIKPSRLVRARHKIIDILTARNEGLSALIAYSRDAHVASPLTDDNNTVANLVPALTPEMMPALGSNPTAGIKTAIELLTNTGLTEGRILLISDGITEQDAENISDLLDDHSYQLSILAVATSDGAPIPLSQGFVKDNSGTIVTPRLEREHFQQLASEVNGRYIETRLDDSDIEFLLPQSPKDLNAATRQTERQFDQWQDRGAYLCLLLLPLALLGFRRGWLLALPFFILLEPQQSYALEWQDLWQTPDQQAMAMMNSGNAEQAAETFSDPNWKAAAQYKAEKFEPAAKHYQDKIKSQASAENHYNYGNALAKSGKLDEALEQYDQALALNPDFEDAAHNKSTVEQAKQQQEQQEQQQGNQDDQQNQDQKNQDSDDQQSDQKNKDQQDSDQQNKDDQDKSDQEQSDKNQPSEDEENTSDPEKDSKDQNKPEQSEDDKSKEQQEEKQEQSEEQQAEQDKENNKEQEKEERQQQAMKQAAAKEADKQEKATEQWLRQIPDDPSGLLRRKFDYEYRLKQAEQKNEQEDQPLW